MSGYVSAAFKFVRAHPFVSGGLAVLTGLTAIGALGEPYIKEQNIGIFHAYSSAETGSVAIYRDPANGKFTVYAQRPNPLSQKEILGEALHVAATRNISTSFREKHSTSCPQQAQKFFACNLGMWDRLSDESARAVLGKIMNNLPRTKEDIQEQKAQIPAVYYFTDDKRSVFIDFTGTTFLNHTSYYVGSDPNTNNLNHSRGIAMNLDFFKDARIRLNGL